MIQFLQYYVMKVIGEIITSIIIDDAILELHIRLEFGRGDAAVPGV